MNISLKQIASALTTLCVSDEHIFNAISELQQLLLQLEEVEVKGRQNVDTLLGCMMALEAIIGKENNDA